MALEVDGTTLETNDNGYLINLDDWTERVAEVMAEKEGITLTEKHWDLIKFLREQYFDEGGLNPNTRSIVKAMQAIWGGNVDSKSIYDLFPMDPSKQGGRIAGVPESRRKGGY